MTAHSSPVWLISGCSTGFGRELAQQTIARGFKVVVTARDTSSIADLVEGHDNALAVALDVTPGEHRPGRQNGTRHVRHH